jgi:ribonuclease-3 family protein
LKNILDYIRELTNKRLNPAQVRMMHPLVLAYIGDTVYDLFVRLYLIHTQETSVHRLHLKSTSYVRAGSQSEALHEIEKVLTDEEKYFVRRGRNAKSGTIPKNASIIDYRWATGFESLIGYLYLTDQEERLSEIMGLILKAGNEIKGDG